MTNFIGTNGNDVATVVPVSIVGFTGGTQALLLDAVGDVFVALGGNDRVIAGNGNDVILGGDGNDFIDGRFGLDVMDGGAGIDTMDVSWFAGAYIWNMVTGITNFSAAGEFAFNFENALTGSGADNVTGTAGNNVIRTNDGNDTINGGAGNDLLAAGAGNDLLTGGIGNDTFQFNTTLNSLTNTDRITDFISAFDTMQLENAVFVGLAAGALAANQFRIGAAALDFDDRIIYNNVTGDIFFDINGALAGGSTRFAHVNPGTFLSNLDFVII